MVPNERLYMSSYLSIIVTIDLSGTITETCNIFVTIVAFSKDVFREYFFEECMVFMF